jgi:hypothetical protein
VVADLVVAAATVLDVVAAVEVSDWPPQPPTNQGTQDDDSQPAMAAAGDRSHVKPLQRWQRLPGVAVPQSSAANATPELTVDKETSAAP